MQDTGHVLFDNLGCGEKRRQMLDEQIKSGERSFREVSEEMWGSLRVPFEDGFEVMQKELEIDQGFKEFHQFCIDNGIIFNVISAGLKPILRKVLDAFLGQEEVWHPIAIKSSTVNINFLAVITNWHCRKRCTDQTRRFGVEADLATRNRTRPRQGPFREGRPCAGRRIER